MNITYTILRTRDKRVLYNVLFYQDPEPEPELEPAPDRKFPEPELPQNRPAPKPWIYVFREEENRKIVRLCSF